MLKPLVGSGSFLTGLSGGALPLLVISFSFFISSANSAAFAALVLSVSVYTWSDLFFFTSSIIFLSLSDSEV
jgi:hypothetical protein